MYIVTEKVVTGGHSRSESTYVYEFKDEVDLKSFLIGRDTSRCKLYQAQKMKFGIELKLEREEEDGDGEFRG